MFYLGDKKLDSIQFNDYIMVTMNDESEFIFNILWDRDKHFYLRLDNSSDIRYIRLFNSNLLICYTHGCIEILPSEVKKIEINSYRYRRQFLIEGRLLKYDIAMAEKYDLDTSFSSFSFGEKETTTNSFVEERKDIKKKVRKKDSEDNND